MTDPVVPGSQIISKPFSKSVKIGLAALAGIFLIYSLSVLSRFSRSQEQGEFETWLAMASVQIIHEKDLAALPVLTLRLIADGNSVETREMKLVAGPDVDSRERMVRILELMRESELFSQKRSEGSEPSAGDLVMNVASPAKNFNLVVPRRAVEKNIKAALMIKLFDEFSRLPVSAMAKLSDDELEKQMMLSDQVSNDE